MEELPLLCAYHLYTSNRLGVDGETLDFRSLTIGVSATYGICFSITAIFMSMQVHPFTSWFIYISFRSTVDRDVRTEVNDLLLGVDAGLLSKLPELQKDVLTLFSENVVNTVGTEEIPVLQDKIALPKNPALFHVLL